MLIEQVGFYSHGCRLAGQLKTPDVHLKPLPVIVEGPGWLALAANALSRKYHEGFVRAGYAVLTFDYRGHGDSEGDASWIYPEEQLEDLASAIAYAEAREDLDEDRLGLFGLGGTGGGNAIIAAARESQVKALVCMTVVADGADWLHRMRREHEWVSFLARVRENRRRRVIDNNDELVDPREDLMVATPERRAAAMPTEGPRARLSSAEALLSYRPVDVVDRISPRALLLTCVENDVVTPEDHALALYDRARPPKKLVRQTGVQHYESYHTNYEQLLGQFIEWYNRYLVPNRITTRTLNLSEEVVELQATRSV
jgi:pimeloyl-ACP methyl ester carboxylesterase